MQPRIAAVFRLLMVLVIVGLFPPMGVRADFDDGVTAYERGDYQNALKELLPIAQSGDLDAQYYLGALYRDGKGVTQDYKVANKWFRKAAEQGQDEALFALSEVYRLGLGVSPDETKEITFLLKAAQSGSIPAGYRVLRGRMWFHDKSLESFQDIGNGTIRLTPAAKYKMLDPSGDELKEKFRKNKIHFAKVMIISAEFGDSLAIQDMDQVLSTMSESDISTARKQALEFKKKVDQINARK